MFVEQSYVGTVGSMFMMGSSGRFTNSLAEMLLYTQKKVCKSSNEYLKYINAPCSYHQLARNWLAENMSGEWLFMTDTDHQFAPDVLVRLLNLSKKYNCQVISGVYQYKYPPHSPVANLWGPNDEVISIQGWPPDSQEVAAVGSVGGGCLLIYREVFDRITLELNEKPFTEYRNISEDYAFCHRCKRLGIPVYLAKNVESHHLIEHAISMADFETPSTLRAMETTAGIIKI